MELRHLRYFVKSAELLHFTEAAAALRVSQPNLSLQIQQLEDEVGSRLFERVGRAVRLTPAGELFLTYAQTALREVEEGQQGIQDLKGLLRGTLRIGLMNTFGVSTFPDILASFVRRYPTIRVLANTGTNQWIEQRIRAGELDLGVVYQSANSAEFDSLQLFKDDFIVVTSRTHRLAKSTSLRIRDLAGIPLALPTSELSSRQVLDVAFHAADLSPTINVETNDVDVLLGMARHGVAVTILTRHSVLHALNGKFSSIPLIDKGLALTAAFIWPRGVESLPTTRFLELARKR